MKVSAILTLVGLVPAPALAQFGLPTSGGPTVRPKDLTPDFEIAPHLEVQLWAKSPSLYNPTAIDVDQRNRVWVAEGVNYRKWQGRNPGLAHEDGDRIVIIEDRNAEAIGSFTKVFVQDKDLVAPLGICVRPPHVLVSCSPHLILYTDADGDDVPESKQILLTGFGGRDHDHGLHSFVTGPDGDLYGSVGNAGPHVVRDASGFTLRSGSLYRDGGPFTADNQPGLVSDDGRMWIGGLVLRVDPRGKNLAVMAHNFRNNYEVALDSYGNLYQSDNDDDGNQACRTLWCMEGGNHGYFSADGSRYWSADKRPSQSTVNAHWHQDDPGVVPAGSIHGAGGPTGVAVYESSVLGAHFEGCILDADAGRGCIYLHRPKAVGAGIELERSIFMAQKPGTGGEHAGWFRPSDVCVASNGAVFIADWWDPGVGGHAAGDREAFGRILRIAPRGTWLYPSRFEFNHVGGAIEALATPAPNVRALAMRSLLTRKHESVPALVKVLDGPVATMRARALWLLAELPGGAEHVVRSLRDADPNLRIVALRALRRSAPERLASVAPALAEDASPAVRRELALALRDVPFETAHEWLVALARGYDGQDRAYLEAFGIACERKEAALWPVLERELGASDPLTWSASFSGLAWRLHDARAVPAFVARARSLTLPSEERRRMCDAIAFVKERAAAEAMLDLALAGPEDLRAYALWWVRNRDTNDWANFGLAASVDSGDLADAELAWSSGVRTSGAVPVDVDLRGSKRLFLVVTEGEAGQSCDWADWLEPRLVGPRGNLALSKTAWASAQAGWGEVQAGMNCAGGPLKLDGIVCPDGIGTHAPSVIVFDVPEGYTHFQARAALDDGGTQQAAGRTDVEFQVHLLAGANRARLVELGRALQQSGTSAADIERSAEQLCADREGGLEVLRLVAQGRLTATAKLALGKYIFENPDLAVRALASAHFPRAAAGGAALPSVADLALRAGDPARGMGLFFGQKAACSTCHAFQGRGGDIGPDLTAIAAKYPKTAVLDAILNPSAGIAFGYDTWRIETKDEELLCGFVLSEGNGSVLLKETSGKRRAVPLADIASRAKQTVSVMPDNVAANLGADELADLLAYLCSDPKRPGQRNESVPLFNGRDLAGWTFHLSEPKARMEDVWSVHDGVLRCTGKPAGYLYTKECYTDFVLELDWRFDPERGPGNSGVLLRRNGPHQVWPRSIEAQLQHRNAGDFWNIDEFAMVADKSRTDGRHTGKALPCNEKPLGEWNHYKITVDGSEVALEVNGEVQNRASFCESIAGEICLQSEGAVIEFRNIVVTPIQR